MNFCDIFFAELRRKLKSINWIDTFKPITQQVCRIITFFCNRLPFILQRVTSKRFNAFTIPINYDDFVGKIRIFTSASYLLCALISTQDRNVGWHGIKKYPRIRMVKQVYNCVDLVS